jgi:hypothetical protein
MLGIRVFLTIEERHFRARISRFDASLARTHLSDDETVAKMGHPDLDVGHSPERRP